MAQVTININDEDYKLLTESGLDLSAIINNQLHKIIDFDKLLRERERRQIVTEPNRAIKYVNAVYTGGGCWLFYGQLNNQEYFQTDDFGYTMILDANPEDLDESLYTDWQSDHFVREVGTAKEQKAFLHALLDRLGRRAPIDDDGGISDEELERYRSRWDDYYKKNWNV